MSERKSQRQRRTNFIFSPDDYVSTPRARPKARAEARRRNVSSHDNHRWVVFVQRMRKLLQKLARYSHYVDVFTSQRWGSSKDESAVQTMELRRSQDHIHRAKKQIVELLKEIAAQNAQDTVWDIGSDDDGMLDMEQISCSRCGSGEATDDNDILLCDHTGCNRAYHQKCLDPPLDNGVSDNPDEDWFCWQCECLDDCIQLINNDLQTNYSSWVEVFQDEGYPSHNHDGIMRGTNGHTAFGLDDSSEDDEDYQPGKDDLEAIGAGDESNDLEQADDSSRSDDSGSGSEDNSDISDEVELESVADSELAALSDANLELSADGSDLDASIHSSDRGRARRRRRPRDAASGSTSVQYKPPSGPSDIGRGVSRTKRGTVAIGKVTGFYVVAGVGPQSTDGSLSSEAIRDRGRWSVEYEDKTEAELTFNEMEAACQAFFEYEMACNAYDQRKEEQQKQRLLLDQGTIDTANVVEGKRRRGSVDYVLLNLQMFGSDVDEDALSSNGEGHASDDDHRKAGSTPSRPALKGKPKKQSKASNADKAEAKSKLTPIPKTATKRPRPNDVQSAKRQPQQKKPTKRRVDKNMPPKSKTLAHERDAHSDDDSADGDAQFATGKKKRWTLDPSVSFADALREVEDEIAEIHQRMAPLRRQLKALQARKRRLGGRIDQASQTELLGADTATPTPHTRVRTEVSIDDISELSQASSDDNA